jgi:hypothetical protein
MIGFDGRHQWRRHKLFKLRAKALQRKKYLCYNRLDAKLTLLVDRDPASKICDPLISCAAHKK